MSIKSFINGFRKIEYSFPLCECFSDMNVTLTDESKSTIQEIYLHLRELPICNPIIGIKDFRCYKLENSDILETSKSPISLVTSFTKEYENTSIKEFNVVMSIISLGLDGKIWKIDVESFISMGCTDVSDFKEFILTSALDLIKAFLHDININAMLKQDYHIVIDEEFMFKNNLLNDVVISGTIEHFGNSSLFSLQNVSSQFDFNYFTLNKNNNWFNSQLNDTLNERKK